MGGIPLEKLMPFLKNGKASKAPSAPPILGLSYREILCHERVVLVAVGMTAMYFALRSAFAQPGSKFAKNPAMAAHGFTFMMPFTYLATKGCYLWLTDASLANLGVADRQFGPHAGAAWMVATMIGAQLFDIPSSLLIGGALASPTFVAHHVVVLWLGVMALRYRFALYYAVYFFGVIELSTPLLAFVDLFRDFPKFAAAFPATQELCRVLFAVAFFTVRIVCWIPVSVDFWKVTLEILARRAPPRGQLPLFVMLAWLVVHAGLTLLQWHWGLMIAKAVYAMIIGDKSAREHEAKGA